MLPRIKASIGIILGIITLAHSVHASTGVGSGGDVIDLYLESTRQALTDTLMKITYEPHSADQLCHCPDNDDTHPLCGKLRSLTLDQQQFCREFLLTSLDPMLQLVQGRHRTPFALSIPPLLVDDPNGIPRPVAAATPLGPTGNIIFHYDSVRTLAPILLLATMTHEFGHKVAFHGQHVDDNPPIGPFDFQGGGRALMDSIGAGLAWYAAHAGLIGREFGVMDTFSCDITETNTGMGLPAIGSSARLFLSKEKLGAYETGIGTWPGQLPCNWRNDQNSIISFQLKIHEEDDCLATPIAKTRRATTIEAWLFTVTENTNEPSPPPKLLFKKIVPGINPLCESDASIPWTIDLPFESRHYHVQMRYRSSRGRMD